MIDLRGRYELKVKRGGTLILTRSGRNLVTTAGEQLAAGRFALTSPPVAITYVAIGSGNAAPTKADTSLASEHSGQPRASGTDSVAGNDVTYQFTLTANSAYTVKEIGLFTLLTGGTMAARFLTNEFSLANLDSLELTWVLQFLGVD